jgi:hypothetical protein
MRGHYSRWDRGEKDKAEEDDVEFVVMGKNKLKFFNPESQELL